MLHNKNAIITGGSRGIGRAIAEEFARCGANVAVVYAGNREAALETCVKLGEYGVQAKEYQCDVSGFSATEELVRRVIEEFGSVDILVNNAGIVKDGLILSMKEEDFDRVISTNLKGAFHMTKHLFSHFMKKRAGRIINITSVVGLTGNAGQANYAAAKAGLIGFTKSTARELAGRGVTCNAIAPGFIETEMTGALSDKVKEKILSGIPMKRPGHPEDVAQLASFLASDFAAYITGEVIRVDGGMCI